MLVQPGFTPVEFVSPVVLVSPVDRPVVGPVEVPLEEPLALSLSPPEVVTLVVVVPVPVESVPAPVDETLVIDAASVVFLGSSAQAARIQNARRREVRACTVGRLVKGRELPCRGAREANGRHHPPGTCGTQAAGGRDGEPSGRRTSRVGDDDTGFGDGEMFACNEDNSGTPGPRGRAPDAFCAKSRSVARVRAL